MRIALFLPHLAVAGGLGVYCRSLLRGLLSDGTESFDVYVPETPQQLFPKSGLDASWQEIVKSPRVHVHALPWPDDLPLSLPPDPALAGALRQQRPDLLHGSYSTALAEPVCKQVVTIHDSGFLEFPQYYGANVSQRHETARRLLPVLERIVTGSNDARVRLAQRLPFPRERLDFVHLPLADAPEVLAAARHASARTQPLWPGGERITDWGAYLFVPVGAGTGVNRVRKNVPAAVRVFRMLKKDTRPAALVIAACCAIDSKLLADVLPEEELRGGGMSGKAWHSHDNAIRIVPELERTPFLSVMAHARVTVYPTRYEGFGLPAIEAMALEVPLVAGNTTSLPEVVGDAGVLIDPDNLPAMVQAIEKVLGDAAWSKELIARGRDRVRRFSIENFGKAKREFYHRALA